MPPSSCVPLSIHTTKPPPPDCIPHRPIPPSSGVPLYLQQNKKPRCPANTTLPDTRAKRRALEYEQKGEAFDLDQIRKDIIERDERDMNREVSPLKQAEDAVLVDSSEMGIDDVVNAILNVYKEKVQK